MNSIRQSIKKSIFDYPDLANTLYRARYLINPPKAIARNTADPATIDGVFKTIYETNFWGDGESVSGPGSTLEATRLIRASLPRLLAGLEVRTLLDAPCGDFNWMDEVIDKGTYSYIGADIVADLVQRLEKRHGDARRSFVRLDVVNDPLPEADVWMCRDCFIHLPLAMIAKALENFLRSGITYLLTTQFDFPRHNVDIAPGDYFSVNFRRPPFNLPRPKAALFDYRFPHAPHKLALWHRDQVAEALRRA